MFNKKVMIRCLSFAFIGVLAMLLLTLGLISSPDAAFADSYTLSLQWANSEVRELNVRMSDVYLDTYFDKGAGENVECNVFAVDAEQNNDWVTTFLQPLDGVARFRVTLDLYCTYTGNSGSMERTLSLKKGNINTSVQLAESSDGHAFIPVYSKNDTSSHTTPYAILDSCKVNGKDYTGQTYSNADIYSITKSGLYSIAKDGVSSMKLKFYINYNKITESGGGDTFTLNSGSIGGSNAALNGPEIGGNLNVLLRSRIDLSDRMDSYIDSNLGFLDSDHVYDGQTNFRTKVVLHTSSSTESGKFYYSANGINSFLAYSGKNGIGEVSGQASSGSTNLNNFSNRLKLVWYEGDEDGGSITYNKKEDNESIVSAAKYKIKIECAVEFDYEVSPLYVSSGYDSNTNQYVEYEQIFEVLKRPLYLDFMDEEGALLILESKEYDLSSNAAGLFTNRSFDSSYWTDEMNGVSTDYLYLQSFIESGLFIFEGSSFDSASIGNNKTIYLKVRFVSIDGDQYPNAEKATKSYRIVPTNGGVEAEYDEGREAYNLGARFDITANGMTLTMSTKVNEEDENEAPFNEIVYGDVLNVKGFDLAKYAKVTGATKSNGEYFPELQANWKVVFKTEEVGTFTADAAHNTVFIVIRLGEKIPIEDTETVAVYTDDEGNRYFNHVGNIYAGGSFNYYFYYDFYVAYTNDPTNPEKLSTADCGGSVSIKSSKNSDIAALEITVGSLLPLSVNTKEVYFTVDADTVKDYDGTNEISNFTCVTEGLLAQDEANYIKLTASARFAHAGAAEDVPIVYTFQLDKKSTSVGDDIFGLVAGSYDLKTTDLRFDAEARPQGIIKGRINRRVLLVEFAQTSYFRDYDTATYVLLEVTPGVYYYYHFSEEGGTNAYGFARQNSDGVLVPYSANPEESEVTLLEDLADEEAMYIKLKLTGFLPGEGYAYEGSEVEDFMLNKMAEYDYQYFVDPLNTFTLLSWVDTSRDDCPITRLTNSSQSPEDLYRLELYEDLTQDVNSVERFRYVGNYILKPGTVKYAYLEIGKLEVDPDDIVINDNGETYLQYTGQSNARTMFENGKIKYDNHKEADQVAEIVGEHPETMLTIIGYASLDDFEHPTNQSKIDSFTLAGDYTVTLTIPATKNYYAFTTEEFVVTINKKMVQVYVTYPWRVYGDDEIVYQQYRYIDDIEDHTVQANMDYEIVDEDGNFVFAYQKNLANGYNVLYSGLVGDETIVPDNENEPNQKHAVVTITLPNGVDQAGVHSDAVTMTGAQKMNYDFVYNSANLYVKKRPLSIAADPVQSKNYTGNQVNPDYVISGGPGALAMYVIEYNGVAVVDEFGEEDERATDVVESGVYKVKVYAKPDASQGASSDNYDASPDRLVVELTILQTQLTLIPESLVATAEYDGQAYEPELFDTFFVGINECSPTVPIDAKYEWGTVEITAFEKMGEIFYDPSLLKDSGEYTLTMLATIDNYDNVFFVVNNEESSTLTYQVHLTIEKASRINFTVQPAANQGILLVAEDDELRTKTFQKIYDGLEATFGYSLMAIGEDMSEGQLNVVVAVDGALFSINNHIYWVDDPVYNSTAANAITSQIAGVAYDIDTRHAMRDARSYTVTFYINNSSLNDYNENFISLVYTCTFEIEEAPLYVYIGFEEGYGPYKIYRTPNADVEEHSFMIYEGWIEGEEELLVSTIDPEPLIDWSDVSEDAYVNGSYTIRAVGGEAPINYKFDHSRSEVEFVIRRADSWIRVYGLYNDTDGSYTDYTYYNGLSVEKEIRTSGVEGAKVKVMRMSGAEPIDVVTEDIGSAGISITYVGRFIGQDKTNITAADIAPKQAGEECKDVGKYVFAISVIASANYNAVPEAYYYLEIKKADLTISFVKIDDHDEVSDDRGYATKVYDRQEVYPTFSVRYSGFLGDDAEVIEYTNMFEVKHENAKDTATYDIEGLELYHPYYVVFNRNQVILPYDVSSYNVRLVITGQYGTCKNYNITVSYLVVEDETRYPQLEITRRPVGVKAGQVVTKIYDAFLTIPAGTITSDNYIFTPLYDAEGNAIENTGLVAGDTIGVGYGPLSRFERKDVFDEHNVQSLVAVRIYDFEITNRNYSFELGYNIYTMQELQALQLDGKIDDLVNIGYEETMVVVGDEQVRAYKLNNKFVDVDNEDKEYFYLFGQINPATADIHFTDEEDNGITTKSEVTYNAEKHEIKVIINGVPLGKNDHNETIYEEVEYTISYDCDDINYHKSEAPVNAQTYKVTVSVIGKNYVNNMYTLELVINKAMVTIVFGGDVVQTYGSVLGGLTAIAYGVGNYEQPLTVRYYDENEIEVRSIITADADAYVARAVHEESANFLYAFADEGFTILRRAVYPNVNVYSSYEYTGKPVVLDVAFTFNGNTYQPGLLFDVIESDGSRTPYNYGDSPISTSYPVSAGEYSVFPADNLRNFTMLTENWTNFRISPVSVMVGCSDLTVTIVSSDEVVQYRTASGDTTEEIVPTFVVSGAVSSEGMEKIFAQNGMPKIRIADSMGNVLSGNPTEAGVYIITPYGGVAPNYNVLYNYGILQVNKPIVQQSVSASSDTPDIIVEGSFGADISLMARVATDTQYNRVRTAYEVFKYGNETYKDYNIYSVYDLRLSDGNVRQIGGGMMVVKLYLKGFFTSSESAYADDGETNVEQRYYVARMSADGTITILEAEKEGDYLSFTTDTLETFAVLSTSATVASATGGYDWLLYVGIAMGVIMIGVALLIVKLRA